MSYNPDTYTVSSNEALTVSIEDAKGTFSFHPKFTYPIFGDSEQIFGFKDLKIQLKFDSITFLPFLKIEYTEKIDGVDIDSEVKDKLMEWLPEDTVIDDELKWEKNKNEQLNLKTELINSYELKGETYNIGKLSVADENTKKILKRIQIFVILFIEAGSYIDLNDTLWDLFLITSKTNEIIGFTTTYTYFYFKNSAEFDNWDFTKGYPNRKKISQFIIFPPYQSNKHGSVLYDSLIEYWNNDDLVKEVTIEDPNEKFDDLRYRCDFERLYKLGFINNLSLNLNDYNLAFYKTNSKKFKLEFQQFKKIIEIGFIYNDKNLKVARLLIKKRLFDKNKEGLLEFEKSVRNDKLQTAYENIKADYLRIIHSLNIKDDDKIIKKQKV